MRCVADRLRRRWRVLTIVAVGVVAVTSATLTGCVQTVTCVSWVAFDSPNDALRAADAALLGTVAGRDGWQWLLGVAANAWTIEIDEVLKGDIDGERVRVVSTPQTCTAGGTYPGGDPLDVDGRVIVFISNGTESDVMMTLTPFDGVVAPAPGGAVPAEWPPGHFPN